MNEERSRSRKLMEFFFLVPFSCFDSVFVSIECKHCWHRTHLRVCSSAFIHCISFSIHHRHHHSDQHSPSLALRSKWSAFFSSFGWARFSSAACAFFVRWVLVAPTPAIAYIHCQYKFTYLHSQCECLFSS